MALFGGEKINTTYKGPLAWCMEGLRGGASDMTDKDYAFDYGPKAWSSKTKPKD